MLKQLSDAMADTHAAVRQCIVQILDTNGSIGTGTVWHADGLIITNAHVVLRQDRQGRVSSPALTVVTANHTRYTAQVIATDTENDLAALAINTQDLPTFHLGDSENLRPGQWVMALGHPWGVRDALTAGVVIGTGDSLPEMRPGREWIALNLTLRPGHSGGALVDTQGRLLGINTMISGPEVGFAVPVHVVKTFLESTLGRNISTALVV